MIEVNRSSIVIRNVDLESDGYKKFERKYSLYNDVEHKYDYSMFDVIDNSLYMPATIKPTLLQSYFPNQNVMYTYKTPIGEDISYKVVHQPRDEIQTEALEFLTSMQNDDRRFRMLNLGTGSGKTFVTISAISTLHKKALIVVDKINLAEQWRDEFLFHTDLTEEDIFIISGRESIEKAKEGNYKIFIVIHNTLGNMIKENKNSINDLMYKLRIGIRVFDECHVNFHNICMVNALSNVEYSILLTATPGRSDRKDSILYQNIFKYVPTYNGHKYIETTDGRQVAAKRYHTVVLMSFDSHPSDKQLASIKTKYGFCQPRWAKFIAEDECYKYYEETLIALLEKFKLIENDKKVAIILPTIALIDKSYDSITNHFDEVEVGKYIGSSKNIEEEKSKRVILTDDKMFGKAIDIPDLDCVINFVQITSKINLEQTLGRLRNNVGHDHVFIDVTDTGYKDCKNMLYSRRNFYKSNVDRIIKINNN